MPKGLICAVVVAIGANAAITAAGATAATLTGAGSTLVSPLAAEWAQGFDNSTGSSVTYDPVGSGTGVSDASSGTVDFGASDLPLSSYSGECGGCKQIPWALSATGIAYDIPGISNNTNTQAKDALKLTGAILAKIYLGQITTWNNPAIVKLNKGLALTSLKITPVWRADACGDTYAFTNFLSDVSTAWSSSKKGYGATISFSAGVGEVGLSGVAAKVGSTPGAIGYLSASYLLAQHVGTAAIQNAAGNYEYPRLNNIGNAAASVKSVPSSGLSIVAPPRSQKIAYPISAFTYAIIPATVTQPDTLENFLTYTITTGRQMGLGLDFEPIPSVVLSYDESVISSL